MFIFRLLISCKFFSHGRNGRHKLLKDASATTLVTDDSIYLTPLALRENMVSYLVRLTTIPYEPSARSSFLPKALALLQLIVGQNGWTDVTVGLRFFARTLEQNDLSGDNATANILAQALSAAKVLQVIAAEQPDSWYISNALNLQQLIRKGLLVEDNNLHEILHHIPVASHRHFSSIARRLGRIFAHAYFHHREQAGAESSLYAPFFWP